MLPFEVTILGSNSAVPMYGRHHTSQYLRIQSHSFLVDCGEGTQLRIQQVGLKAQKLEAIFISHLHGDHYLGLVGLLSSMHLLGRKKELHLFAPAELAEIITIQLRYSDTTLRYMLHFHPITMDESSVIYETKTITVSAFPVQHRIPCVGFYFKEKPFPLKIEKNKLPADISLVDIGTLKRGDDVLDAEGNIMYKNEELTLGRKKSRSYAYCTDTLYIPELADYLKGTDLLYHEATFQTVEELNASNTFHSSAGQAATLARDAKVGKLLLGHFSARYKELEPLEVEAQKIFKESYLAKEGITFAIDH